MAEKDIAKTANNPLSKEALEKKIEWAHKSAEVAEDTIELLSGLDYDNDDCVITIDLCDIVHNLAVMRPDSSRKLVPTLLEEYKIAKKEMENLRDNSRTLLNSIHA